MFQSLYTFLLVILFALIHSNSSSILHTRSVETEVITTCTDPKTFALTFDDGPYYYENKLSDYLSDRGILGTFFINGYNYECIYDEEIVKQLKHTFKQGHLIGSHSWSHPDISKLNDAQLNQQLELIEIAMKKILGVVPRYFRPPYGSINEQNLGVLRKRGYKVINWSFESGDATGVSASDSKQAYTELAKKFPDAQIALNHETYETTVSDVIPYAVGVLQRAGYKLVSVADCLGLGNSPNEFYQYIGTPSQRDDSWTCDNTPAPGVN